MWRPAAREPSPLLAAVLDYVRLRAPQAYGKRLGIPYPLGRADVVLAESMAVIDLTLTPLEAAPYGARAAMVFGIAGHAAMNRAGYEVKGSAIVDRQSLAFLEVTANLFPLYRK